MNAKSHSEDRMAPPVSRFYRPELDVIRFLAFGLVFLHHSIPMHDKRLGLLGDVGPLGICLFFVLSSFLITELLRIEKQRTGTIRIRAFYIRRVLRIWPLYFLFLALAVLIGILQPDLHIPVKAVLAFVLLAGNWYAAAHGFVQGFAGPLWSISLEEQFYVIWPSACRFLNKRFLTGLSVLLIPVGVVATYYLAQEGALRSPAIWVNTFVQFQMFCYGPRFLRSDWTAGFLALSGGIASRSRLSAWAAWSGRSLVLTCTARERSSRGCWRWVICQQGLVRA